MSIDLPMMMAGSDADLSSSVPAFAELPPLGVWPSVHWDPVLGCSPVDAGCRLCYAAAQVASAAPNDPAIVNGPIPRFSGKLRHGPRVWDLPTRQAEPVVCFAFSRSDLFHEQLPEELRVRAFDVMRQASWVQFNVLTKRADRMARWSDWPANVRAGISASTTDLLAQRWPYLRDLPARWKHVSVEPMFEPVSLPPDCDGRALNWLTVMREVGPGARGLRPDDVRELRVQCEARGIHFFWERTSLDSMSCRAERRRAMTAGHPYQTQDGERE